MKNLSRITIVVMLALAVTMNTVLPFGIATVFAENESNQTLTVSSSESGTIEMQGSTSYSNPTEPKCPFDAKSGRTIINFNGRIRSDKGSSDALTNTVSKSLDAGTYTVRLAGWDGYNGRENVSQPKEQWKLEFLSGGSVVKASGATTDVPDKVREATVTMKVNDDLVVPAGVNALRGAHAFYPNNNTANSLNPICAALDKKDEPQPTPPQCPFDSKDGRVIVNFSDRIRSDQSQSSAQTATKNVNLNAGKYTVSLAGWDGYNGRENAFQPNEQWKLQFLSGGSVVATTNSTPDVPDNTREALVKEVVGNPINLAQSISAVRGVHAMNPKTHSPNSLNPICAAFDPIEEKPKPECTLEVDTTVVPYGGGDVTFTWTTENVDEVSFNRGIGVVPNNGSKTITVTDSATYVLTAKGPGGTEQCSKAITVATDEEPTPPQCPFDSKDGRVIVNFSDRIRSDQSQSNAQTATKNVNLDAGKYTVRLAGWDGYIGREHVIQPNEQWKLEFLHNGNVHTTSGITSDVTDKVRQMLMTDTVNSSLDISQTITAVRGTHAFYPSNNTANSLNPICAAFDKEKEVTPDPECTLTTNVSEVPAGGGDVTLTWTSKHADSTTLNQGIGNVASNGSRTVSVDSTTNFIFTVTNDAGTHTCPVKVTVPDTPDPLTCSDVNFRASDTSVDRGDRVTLSWDWNDPVERASINQGIGSVNNNDSTEVRVTSDITYTMTIENDHDSRQCPVSIDVDSGGGGGSSSPRCELEISDTRIRAGEEIELTWETSRATEVVIEDDRGNTIVDSGEFIGDEKEDLFDDSITLRPTRDTTYTLNASRGTRDDECEVEVEVGDDVTVTQTRTQDPIVAGISLTQVPYTGFEAGPLLTMIFYALLTIWSLFVAYLFVIRRDSFANVSFAGAFGGSKPLTDASVETEKSNGSPAADYVASATHTVAAAPTNLPVGTPEAVSAVGYQAYTSGISTEEQEMNELENRAHGQKALISSDAMRYLMNAEATPEARMQKLDSVIRVAKVTFPAEDGWIVLNLPRMETLLGDRDASATTKEEAAPAPTNGGSLAEAIVTGNVIAAFGMIENRPMLALADAASDLDALYRARKGEMVTVSDMLSREASTLTDAQLESIISALTSAIDGTYQNEAEAVKIAIMKAVKSVA